MARQDARLQGEHALGREQPHCSPQRHTRSLTPRGFSQRSSTPHAPKSGQRTRTRPLCLPSALVPIPSATIPRTFEPSHDPPSTLPRVPRPKEAAGSRRSPASCEVSVVLGDRDCAHTRATRAPVGRASSAAIPPSSLSHSPGRGGGGAPRRDVPNARDGHTSKESTRRDDTQICANEHIHSCSLQSYPETCTAEVEINNYAEGYETSLPPEMRDVTVWQTLPRYARAKESLE